jgi:glycerophosphoryl diester phosphodiesterase
MQQQQVVCRAVLKEDHYEMNIINPTKHKVEHPMPELDEILYNALRADADLMTAVDGRVESTCFEVSPDEQDNTQLPCIIVTDDGLTNNIGTKDTEWESNEDRVQASIEVDAESPKAVKQLLRMVRRAVANHIRTMADNDEEIPCLQSVQTSGVAWDWTKPCYHETITYTCDVQNDL